MSAESGSNNAGQETPAPPTLRPHNEESTKLEDDETNAQVSKFVRRRAQRHVERYDGEKCPPPTIERREDGANTDFCRTT